MLLWVTVLRAKHILATTLHSQETNLLCACPTLSLIFLLRNYDHYSRTSLPALISEVLVVPLVPALFPPYSCFHPSCQNLRHWVDSLMLVALQLRHPHSPWSTCCTYSWKREAHRTSCTCCIAWSLAVPPPPPLARILALAPRPEWVVRRKLKAAGVNRL